jgi:hypothetical protein
LGNIAALLSLEYTFIIKSKNLEEVRLESVTAAIKAVVEHFPRVQTIFWEMSEDKKTLCLTLDWQYEVKFRLWRQGFGGRFQYQSASKHQ